MSDYIGVHDKIKSKDLDILNKWTKGAMARRRFVKLVLTKSIQSKFKEMDLFIYLLFLLNKMIIFQQLFVTF